MITILVIRSPWGQSRIVNKVVDYVTEKTNTKVEIERLFITFSGNIFLEGLYLEDKKGDTLIYSKNLEASVALIPLIKGDKFNLKSLDWSGVKANIKREQATQSYNYDFLIKAFASDTLSNQQKNDTSENFEIEIGTINFNDFDLSYIDEVGGTESSLQLGKLQLEIEELDLDNMKFHIEDLSIANSKINYKQTKPSVEAVATTLQQDTPLPTIRIDQLQISQIQANYESLPDQVIAAIDIKKFLLELPEANLNTQTVVLKTITLSDSDISFRSDATPQVTDTTAIKTPTNFEWPKWNIKADQMLLENNHIAIQTDNNSIQKGAFNPSAMDFQNLNFDAETFLLVPGKVAIDLKDFSFQEKSGFQLQKIALKLRLSEKLLSVSDVTIATQNSVLKGSSRLNYESINQLLNTPEYTKVNLQIPTIKLNVEEAYFFQPDLKKNEYIDALAQKEITGNLATTGTLSDLQINTTKISWGASTTIQLRGIVKNILDTNALQLETKPFEITTNQADITSFVSERELGISIPKTIVLQGNLEGGLDHMSGTASLDIPEGFVKIKGTFINQQNIAFDGHLEVQKLELDKLLKNEQLGTITFTAKASGSGSSINTLNATLQSDFKTLEFNTYDFSDLSLAGNIDNGKGKVEVLFKDKNLDFGLITTMQLDTIASKFNVLMDLKGANLNALGITRENIKTKVKINTDFTGNTTDFILQSDITEGVAVYNNKSYNIGDFNLMANIQKDSTSVQVTSQMLTTDLRSNTNPSALIKAVQQKFKSYLSDSVVADTLSNPVQMKMDLAIRPTPILNQVFVRGLEKLDTITMEIDFNENKEILTAALNAPLIQYKENVVDSLQFRIDADKDNMGFRLGWATITSGPITLKKTYLDGSASNDTPVILDFNSFDDNEKLAHIRSEIRMANDTLQYHIDPLELVINKKQWTIPSDNNIQIANQFIGVKNFTLGRNQQEISIRTDIPDRQKEHLGVTFKNFNVSTIMSLLNPDTLLADGVMQGDLIIEEPFGDTGILADFNIQSLQAMQIPLGNLALQAASKTGNAYDFNLALKGKNIDLDLQGDYVAASTGAQLNLDVLLNELKTKTLEGFLGDAISDTQGSLSGKVKITGTTKEPQYLGHFNFEGTSLVVNTLNSRFTLPDETIKIDNSGVSLDNFTIADADKNTFKLDGNIITDNLINPSFDLTLNAKKFQVLNSTKKNNDFFYGKVKINADLNIKGDLEVPEVDGTLKINEKSDFTLIVPESQLDVVEREGVLLFVNKKNPDDILTRVEEDDSSSATLKGYDINTILTVDKNSTFTIVIDERSGDNFQVSGIGDFNLGLEPNGRTTLSGKYEVDTGHYEASLYNLVKRKFEIAPGSTITWSGDPLDAALDVRAIYNVETAASGLMATKTSAEGVGITNRYQQKLPFLVYLNVDGALLQPEISFNLDMPEDEQGALGGEVYGQVQQLNTREEELNKQVFSLLVLNRFFPGSGSDGSAGGASSIARDNVNKVLSGQLNNFSDKLIGNSGLELDFDLDSYTDYQGNTPQDRTQLDINARKRLFNDRLIVQVGSEVDVEGSSQNSGESTPVIGNVSLEYLLTQNGRYRLKGFRKNEFESVIDGQLIVTGIAFIFNREFNKFKELWTKSAKEISEIDAKKNNEKE